MSSDYTGRSGRPSHGRSNSSSSNALPSSPGTSTGSVRGPSGPPQGGAWTNGNGGGLGYWNPPLPGAGAYGNSFPGEGFDDGMSTLETVVEPGPSSPARRQRVVVHNPNGAAGRRAVNGDYIPPVNRRPGTQFRQQPYGPPVEVNNTVSRERLQNQALHRYTANNEDRTQQFVNNAGQRPANGNVTIPRVNGQPQSRPQDDGEDDSEDDSEYDSEDDDEGRSPRQANTSASREGSRQQCPHNADFRGQGPWYTT